MRLARIKPCPFCGSCDRPRVERWDICVFGIVCDECGARGPVVERGDYSGDDKDLVRASRDSIREWNARQRAKKVWGDPQAAT